MSKRKEILKQAGVYSGGSVLTQLITVVAGILCRRFLGPLQMGIWSTLQIILDYSKYSTLGVMNAVSREIPYHMGKGEEGAAEKIKNITFTFIVVTSIFIGLCFVGFVLLTRGYFTPELTYGLFFIAAIIFLQRINNLFISLLRSYKEFSLAAKQMVLSALVNAVLVAFLTYFFKIYGFMCSVALSFVFNIVYIQLHYKFHFRWQFSLRPLWPLIRFGFPLMIIGLLITVLRSIDKIMIVKMLGFESLGLYSIAIMIYGYAGSFSTSIAVVLFPHFQEKFGKSDRPEDLKNYLLKASKAFALSMPVIIGLIWTAAPFFAAWFLPQYISGIPAMKNLSLALFFIALTQPYQDFLITTKKHFFLFPLLSLSSLLAFLLDYAVIRLGYGITGVAYMTAMVFMINFITTYLLSARYIADRKTIIVYLLKFFACFAYLILILFGINSSISVEALSLKEAIVKTAVFLLLCLPYFIVLNKEFGLIALIKKKFIGEK